MSKRVTITPRPILYPIANLCQEPFGVDISEGIAEGMMGESEPQRPFKSS
jgi:hypothetical protein